ncbi:MAG: CHAT domain-containing protein, partial [Sphingobacteriales bacterium]
LKNSILKNHNALIEIYEGDSAVYVWSFDKQAMKITKASKCVYDSLLKLYIAGLARQPTLKSQVAEWEKASAALYKLMFADHHLPVGRIIFSPDRNIIPFECLITGYTDNKPRYLIHAAALSYTYSAAYLQEVQESGAGNASANFAGFAPVRFSPALKLNALIGSDRSLEKIEDDFRESAIHLGMRATRASFIEGLGRNNIMHLYTHAAVNRTTGEPEIYFCDSVLTLNEMVLGSAPTARLINLAACETALGKSYYGEGVFSFSRVLASYGIPSSVANVWSVPDKPTYQLNELFYKFLSEGMTPDVALQHAKLVFLREAGIETALPYYWGASILTGESDIAFPPRKWQFTFIALAVCVILIGFVWALMRGLISFKR